MLPVSCKTCGAETTPEARYCAICGADLPVSPNGGGATNGAARSWIIGSAVPSDIVVANSTVSARHCKLTASGGDYTIEDLGSSNGTYVGGRRITAPSTVQPNQPITLGRNVPFPWPQVLPQQGGTLPPASISPGAQIITVGRSTDNDVVLDYPTISGYHARVILEPTGAILEDLGSMNGTAIGSVEKKIVRASLKPNDRVFFGSYPVPASRLLAPGNTATGTQPRQTLVVEQERSVVGRDPSCDFPLPFPSVSWRHAELVKTPRGMEIHDLKSLNGTFVNGRRISGTHLLQPGDVVSLGSITLALTGGGELERRDYKGNVTIEIDQLCVNARGANSDRLLENVNLTVFPTELVALMGPSGAGKTTLLKALNGYTIPTAGQVLFNGNSLYSSFDSYRLELGYVPQDDIIHPLLTVSEALYFAARLRTDLRDSEIKERLQTVLQTLDISGISGKLIGSPERKVISGGQRKRVNIAMELICDPTVLFLDEPTSGLSSSDSLKVVKHLYELARGGKTIMLTIHQPSTAIYKLFDQLIMVSRDSKEKLPPGVPAGPARLVYYGPAWPDSLEFFNPDAVRELRQRAPGCDPSPEVVFDGLETSDLNTGEWEAKYQSSPQKRLYQDERKGAVHTTGRTSDRSGQRFRPDQLISLIHRNLILKLRDRLQTGILLAQAPGFALLVYLAFQRVSFAPSAGEWLGFTGKLASIQFLMVIASIWFGCNNAVREVVGEWPIFEREQMAGLKIPLYILSKFIVLGGLCVFQCLSLLAIVYVGCNLQGNFLRIFAILLLNAFCGVGLGLCISARFKTTDSALACLPLVLLPMIVLAGGMQPLYTMNGATQTIAMVIPSRWGYEANLLTESAAQPHYAYNPCQGIADQAAEQARQAVIKTQRMCEDQMRAQDRAVRERFGPLASTVLPPAPKKGASLPPPPKEQAKPTVPATDIAEGAFPSAPKRPDFLKFLPDRSSYRLCFSVLAGMQMVLLGFCYWLLRRRVVH
jgi:ABC transport system ATP-binding/permease protein